MRDVIVEPHDIYIRADDLAKQGKKVAILGQPDLSLPAGIELIPLGGDASTQARGLYAALRKVDDLGCDVVLATPPPLLGLGAALLDRLQKAAGPRSPETQK